MRQSKRGSHVPSEPSLARVRPVFLATLLLAPSLAWACDLDDARSAIGDSAGYLRRAERSSSLDDAGRQMRRAASSLDDADNELSNCGCDAASDFEDAAMYARRAKKAADSGDVREFRSDYGRTVQAFNSGVSSARRCRLR